MKKLFRKVAAISLSAFLAISSCATAFAADGGESASTQPPDLTRTDCSITVHKYQVPTSADWTTQENQSGTALESGMDGLKPWPNVTFKLFKVVPIDESKSITDSEGRLVNDQSHLAVIDQTTGELDTEVLANDNLQLDPDAETTTWTGTTGSDGTYTFNDLPTGKYLMAEMATIQKGGSANSEETTTSTSDESSSQNTEAASTASANDVIADPADPFLINLPTQYKNDDGTYSYNYNVNVYPKNGTLDIHKAVQHLGNQDHTAAIGENETWIISPSVPHDIARAKEYAITDPIDSRLTYTKGQEVVVKPAGTDGSPIDGAQALTAGTDYTVTEPDDSNDATLSISFSEAGRKALSDAGAKRVYISYTTVINTSVIDKNFGTAIPNKAQLHYTNFYGNTITMDSETPEVHTGAIEVSKVSSSDAKTVLEGATFAVYASKEDAAANKNPLELLSKDGKKQKEVVTDKSGKAYFYGLAYGPKATLSEKAGVQEGAAATDTSVSTTYYLRELKAPSGYQANNNVIEVKLDASNNAVAVVTVPNTPTTPATPNKPQAQTPTTPTPNNPLSNIIPKTGQSPFVLAVVLACAAGATIYLIRSRKRKEQDA